MKKKQILEAWRNADYYADLSPEQRAALPANPAALPTVDDGVLASITGGCCPPGQQTAICSPCPPQHCY